MDLAFVRLLRDATELEAVARIALEAAIKVTGAQAGWLGVVDEGELHVYGSYGYTDLPATSSIYQSILKSVLDAQEPILNTANDDRVSQLIAPLCERDNVLGLLFLESATDFTGEDQNNVGYIADVTSLAVANIHLRLRLEEENQYINMETGFLHDIRAPLASILGYSHLIMEVYSQFSEDEIKEFAEIIHSTAAQVGETIDNLKHIRRIQSLIPHPVSIDLQNEVKSAIGWAQKQIDEKNQTVITNFAEDLPPVFGDSFYIADALHLLLNNASKFSSPDSTIKIEAEVIDGDMLCVVVQDEGIGMGEDDLQHIFKEKWFRSHNTLVQKQWGMGMGAWLVGTIIKRHGGKIWAESELGVGTKVFFTLPIYKP